MNRLLNTMVSCIFCMPGMPPTPPLPPSPPPVAEAIPVAVDAMEHMIADRVPSDYSLTDAVIEENERLKQEIQRLNGVMFRKDRMIERLKIRIRELEQR